MPYCPKCCDEFQDWVKVCPDCGVALVDKLPASPRRERHDESLIQIATAPSEAVAHMWKGVLEDHDIRCLLRSTDLNAAMYVLPGNLQYEIHVLASEAERAAQILATLGEGNQASYPSE